MRVHEILFNADAPVSDPCLSRRTLHIPISQQITIRILGRAHRGCHHSSAQAGNGNSRLPIYPRVRGSTLSVQGDKLVTSPAPNITAALHQTNISKRTCHRELRHMWLSSGLLTWQDSIHLIGAAPAPWPAAMHCTRDCSATPLSQTPPPLWL